MGEGLGDVVVSRVLEIRPIKGADKIRLVVVDAGADPLEIVCGAHNFEVGDRVPLAPVGAILPGGFEIGRRKLRGVESNGMLCSGKELGLSEDQAGLLILGDEAPGEPGTPLMEALGLEPDVVFDITVEGNRPDAWSMTGIARDLAGRLALPFSCARCTSARAERPAGGIGRVGFGRLARAVSTPDGERARRGDRRSLAAVDRPPAPAGRHAADQQRGRRLELRHARARPAHPPLRPGPAARARAVGPAGAAGRDGRDPRRCVADGRRAGPQPRRYRRRLSHLRRRGTRRSASAASWAAPPRRSSASTTEVLLEAAYFTPMAIARTSKRLGLRTEASARFERGCDPWAIEPSVQRFCQLLAESVPTLRVADGMLDVRGDVPEPFVVSVPIAAGAAPDRGEPRRRADRAAARADRLRGPRGGGRPRSRWWCRPTGPTCGASPTASMTSLRRSPAPSATATCHGTSRPGPSPAA